MLSASRISLLDSVGSGPFGQASLAHGSCSAATPTRPSWLTGAPQPSVLSSKPTLARQHHLPHRGDNLPVTRGPRYRLALHTVSAPQGGQQRLGAPDEADRSLRRLRLRRNKARRCRNCLDTGTNNSIRRTQYRAQRLHCFRRIRYRAHRLQWKAIIKGSGQQALWHFDVASIGAI